ncbi:MAG: tRNA1(Val) (adenine(37)-N6)-methyltransferase [Helicobacteraceae bacterium]
MTAKLKNTEELVLKQPASGYRYGSDTIILYDFFASQDPHSSVLDVGSGCGILALLTKRDYPLANVYGIELQKEMFDLCLYNRQKNNLDVTFINCALADFAPSRKFDFIVSNPPFFAKETQQSKNKITAIAKYDDFLPFEDLARKAAKILKPSGKLVFCYSAGRLGAVMAALEANGLQAGLMRFVHNKKDKDASLVLICAVKSKKRELKILPPLVAHKTDKPSAELRSASARAKTKTAR